MPCHMNDATKPATEPTAQKTNDHHHAAESDPPQPAPPALAPFEFDISRPALASALWFRPEEFRTACAELDEPSLVGWELFSEAHGVQIYRQPQQNSNLYKYKTYGTMDVDLDTCRKVYLDLEYRKVWDSYIKEITVYDKDDPGYIYWRVHYPFPLSNRDYVFVRESQELEVNGEKVHVVLSKTDPTLSHVPQVKGVVRVTQCTQSIAMTAFGEGGTKAFGQYFDDPGGLIPSWVINWAAKTGLPAFISQMRDACKNYDKYLKKKHCE